MKAKGTSKKKTILLEREFFNLFPNIYVQTWLLNVNFL
jgi:hypothetical protein